MSDRILRKRGADNKVIVKAKKPTTHPSRLSPMNFRMPKDNTDDPMVLKQIQREGKKDEELFASIRKADETFETMADRDANEKVCPYPSLIVMVFDSSSAERDAVNAYKFEKILYDHSLIKMNPRDIPRQGDHIKEAVGREGIGEEFKKRVLTATVYTLIGKSVIEDVPYIYPECNDYSTVCREAWRDHFQAKHCLDATLLVCLRGENCISISSTHHSAGGETFASRARKDFCRHALRCNINIIR